MNGAARNRVTLLRLTELSPEKVFVFAVILIAIATRLWFGPFIIDDAYITFRYARNIATGVGFVYNQGQFVLGTTTPLFTVLLAALGVLRIDLSWAAYTLGIVADVGTIVMLYLVFARLEQPWLGPVAGLLVAVMPRFVTYSVSGMETSLYVFAVVSANYFYMVNRTWVTAIVCGVATLIRPDGVILAVVLGAHYVLIQRRIPLREIGIFVLLLAPWLLFSVSYFGTFLPNTLAAKGVAHHDATSAQSFKNLLGFFSDTAFTRSLSIAALIGAVVALRSYRDFSAWILWAVVYCLAFISAKSFLSFYLWYYTPLLPIYFALSILGIYSAACFVSRLFRRQISPRRMQAAVSISLFILFTVTGFLSLIHHKRQLEMWASGREELYRNVATKIDRETSRESILAAPEIGALGYFYHGPILDTVGLISPEAVGKKTEVVIREGSPEWIVAYDTHLDSDLQKADWFKKFYRLKERYYVSAERSLLVFQRQ